MNILIVTECVELRNLMVKVLEKQHGIKLMQDHIDIWLSLSSFYDLVIIDHNIAFVNAIDIAKLVRNSGYKCMKVICLGESTHEIFDNIFNIPQNARQIKAMIERTIKNDRFNDTGSFGAFRNM